MPNKKANKAKTKKNASSKVAVSNGNKNKIIAIVVAVVAIITLLLSLTSCHKSTDPKKLKGEVKKEEQKEEKKKEEKTITDNSVYYETIANIVPMNMVYATEEVAKVVEEEKDTTAPVVTLNGEEEVIVEYMEGSYTEEGAKYTDNKDGNGEISKPSVITFEGEKVDEITNAQIGTYVLVYMYADKAGNTSTKTRTVVVSDTTKPTVNAEVTSSDRTNASALYKFTITDHSDVVTAKIVTKDDNYEETKEYFETNGIDLTVPTNEGEPYEYLVEYNDTYVVYTEDEYENGDFYEFVESDILISTNSTTNADIYNRKITIDRPEGATVTDIKAIKGQSRLRTGSGWNSRIRNATENDFENIPNGYELIEYEDNADYIIITDDKGESGDHWYYIHYNVTTTDDQGTENTATVITEALAPEDNGV